MTVKFAEQIFLSWPAIILLTAFLFPVDLLYYVKSYEEVHATKQNYAISYGSLINQSE